VDFERDARRLSDESAVASLREVEIGVHVPVTTHEAGTGTRPLPLQPTTA
jgi:hypothetical protein